MTMEHTASSETYQTTRCHHYPQNFVEQIPCSYFTHTRLGGGTWWKLQVHYRVNKNSSVDHLLRPINADHTHFNVSPAYGSQILMPFQGFKTQFVRIWHTANVPRAPPTPTPFLDFITRHKPRNLSLFTFLASPVTSPLLAAAHSQQVQCAQFGQQLQH
jgi:hypothetical protein